MTISPNLGEIGAPQLGHFKDETPEAAITGAEVVVGLGAFNPVLVPHLTQKAASSESWVPHLWQYNSSTNVFYARVFLLNLPFIGLDFGLSGKKSLFQQLNLPAFLMGFWENN